MNPASTGRLSAKCTAAPQAMPPMKRAAAHASVRREISGERGWCSRSSRPSGPGGGEGGGRRNMRGIVAQPPDGGRDARGGDVAVYARRTRAPSRAGGGVAQRLEQASYTRHVGGSKFHPPLHHPPLRRRRGAAATRGAPSPRTVTPHDDLLEEEPGEVGAVGRVGVRPEVADVAHEPGAAGEHRGLPDLDRRCRLSKSRWATRGQGADRHKRVIVASHRRVTWTGVPRGRAQCARTSLRC